jgi:dTDP-4-dehydrorhamnose 3,5-epimerase-like enzyme
MRVEQLRTVSGQTIEGLLLPTPCVFADERGFFLESWNQRVFAEALGVNIEEAPLFRQDNQSRCFRGGVAATTNWSPNRRASWTLRFGRNL